MFLRIILKLLGEKQEDLICPKNMPQEDFIRNT